MNAEQTRYIEIVEKLGSGEQLSRSEQHWLYTILAGMSETFFPPSKRTGRTRLDERNFWMTADSELSGDAEKVVAKRWGMRGRIGVVLTKWRPEVSRVLGDLSKPGLGVLIAHHRKRFVKKRA